MKIMVIFSLSLSHTHTHNHSLSLSLFLFPRYHLLLREILKYTPHSHEDYGVFISLCLQLTVSVVLSPTTSL